MSDAEVNRLPWHEWFKFTVYILLAVNVLLFFDDEWDASGHLFGASVPLAEIITAFAASIDTLAWVILLLLFELETYQIPDEKLNPPLSTGIRTLRAVCYGFIVYAFYGYASRLVGLYGYEFVSPGSLPALCTLEDYSMLLTLDEYELLGPENCGAIETTGGLFHLAGAAILAEVAVWQDTVRLGWVDVINSGTWLLVVALLELDVRLQVRGVLEGAWLAFSQYAKYLLYGILFLAALYWGVEGEFLDFWDAFLWLVAFVFIEMNVFEWREELQEAQAVPSNRDGD